MIKCIILFFFIHKLLKIAILIHFFLKKAKLTHINNDCNSLSLLHSVVVLCFAAPGAPTLLKRRKTELGLFSSGGNSASAAWNAASPKAGDTPSPGPPGAAPQLLPPTITSSPASLHCAAPPRRRPCSGTYFRGKASPSRHI